MTTRILRQLRDHHLPQLVRLYQGEFWCNTRKTADVLRMLNNTDIVIGVVDDKDELCGFCRLLTDYQYKATLYEVIVKPVNRNQQIGRLLMESVIDLPELREVEHIDLSCLSDMLPFYRRFGFTEQLESLQQMRRFHTESEAKLANNTEENPD